MADNAHETFLAESRELLQEMESALLQMEHDPDDEDLINSLFRSAHTIKGTSGVFSFDHVEAFTHTVENVLERMRAGKIVVDSALIALLLNCRDQIEILVESAVAEEEPENDVLLRGSDLQQQLKRYLGEDPQQPAKDKHLTESKSPVEVLSEGRPVQTDNWHISLRFSPDVLKNGMDPLSFLRYLRRLGEIVHISKYPV